MTERTWHDELPRFRAMTQIDQLGWLSQLLHLISMFARDTYEVGTDGVAKPSDLRRFNELIHRVATFQKKVATANQQGMPDADIFALIEHELFVLNVAIDDVLRHLP
ncbi:hypothetical protein [Mitsuaria sp. 7]|uniref:hypothetical protein n=1 Tax=Mitsuaria sp. 7 TaxID=1658665 RepID=UPI0007DD8F00|nr:hypothetical protein [Mitsuaria sp. 7]ANH68024.1 hypothetical protein ABE85_11375 [Mitsuaria sp. 7]